MNNIYKLPSGSYQYRKMIKGEKITATFDHKPTALEIAQVLSQSDRVPKNSFKYCCENYIKIKEPVLSPSTIRSYNTIIRVLSDDLLKADINNIDQIMIQNEISQYSVDHSPKSTRNLHGFISAVLAMYRPNLHLHTTLPQKIKYEAYVPSEEDIKAILEESANSPYHVAIQLGILGMRRSEICGLQDSDLSGNTLSISRAMVRGNNGWVIKNYTKTTEGKRTIYVPDNLVREVQKNGLYKGSPITLVHYLHRIQDKLGLPRFRFHDLRIFYCSFCHSQNVPDAVVMQSGGWRSTYTMVSVYRKAMEKDKIKYQEQIAKNLL